MSSGRRTLDGTLRLFLAESLILPTGLVTTAVLTRQLGTDGYGLFTLAATLVAWIEWSIAAMFGRATNQCISAAADWRPVATTVVRLHLAVSCVCAVGLALLAGPIAGALGEPVLATYLRLFAIDLPIFSLARAHSNILVGTGGYRHRAKVSVGRWVARLVLIVVLVEFGFSITGAIVASIGASLVELVVAWHYTRPPLLGPGASLRQLCRAAWPLFLSAMALRLFDKLDLFFLKNLGATAEQAGVYGVAQNLTIVPGLFAMSFAPLLLATLTRLVRDGSETHARAMGRDALRLVILLLPFAGLTAGASGEIVRAIAGAKFSETAPLLALLIFGGVATTLLAVATAILTAAGKAQWTFTVTGPLVLLAIVGHRLLIPQYGAFGAALVTTGVAWVGAIAAVGAVYQLWRVVPPAASVARSLALCVGAYILASVWPVTVWVKLPVIMGLVGIGYLALGEINARERALLRSFLPGKSA